MAYRDEQHHHDRHPARYFDDPDTPPTLSDPTFDRANIPHYYHARHRSDVINAGQPNPAITPFAPVAVRAREWRHDWIADPGNLEGEWFPANAPAPADANELLANIPVNPGNFNREGSFVTLGDGTKVYYRNGWFIGTTVTTPGVDPGEPILPPPPFIGITAGTDAPSVGWVSQECADAGYGTGPMGSGTPNPNPDGLIAFHTRDANLVMQLDPLLGVKGLDNTTVVTIDGVEHTWNGGSVDGAIIAGSVFLSLARTSFTPTVEPLVDGQTYEVNIDNLTHVADLGPLEAVQFDLTVADVSQAQDGSWMGYARSASSGIIVGGSYTPDPLPNGLTMDAIRMNTSATMYFFTDGPEVFLPVDATIDIVHTGGTDNHVVTIPQVDGDNLQINSSEVNPAFDPAVWVAGDTLTLTMQMHRILPV